jgi:hypothetical protein
VRRHLVTTVALVLAACGGGGDVPPPSDSAAVVRAPDSAVVLPEPAYTWYGVYTYDPRRPTFRPCDHALPFALRGSDSLLAFLQARIDFQAERPVLRVIVAAAGDTSQPDPYGPPVFTVTGVGTTHTPQPGECAPAGPAPAPPVREAALRRAMTAAGITGGAPRVASAYLDGDDRADAIVLLTSGPTCTPAGCDLAVFRAVADSGYALVSRTQHVKAPVAVREARSDGLRILLVGVGQGGGFPDRDARLMHRAGRGYPRDARVEPPAVQDPFALVLVPPPRP